MFPDTIRPESSGNVYAPPLSVAHNPEIADSNPAVATIKRLIFYEISRFLSKSLEAFFVMHIHRFGWLLERMIRFPSGRHVSLLCFYDRRSSYSVSTDCLMQNTQSNMSSYCVPYNAAALEKCSSKRAF